MLNPHVTDEEIQVYLLEESKPDKRIAEHIHFCEACKAKVTAYRLLFTGLKEVEKPAFEFNLAELVVAQLPEQQIAVTRDRLAIFLVVLIAVIIGAAMYIFRPYLASLFNGIASAAVYLMAVSMAIILFFFCLDMYKNYQKKMQALDFA